MSTSEKITVAPKVDAPLLENRFALRRKMSTTALADVYWADDLHAPTQGEQDHIVLLVLVAPTISSLPGFTKVWSAVLSRPAPPAVSYPTILDWGSEGHNYWFTCSNTQGTLLSEYFNELDKRGLAPDQAFSTTEAISHALSNVQAGAFGYFEPGATLRTDHGYVLLNAPLAKMMHSLLLQQTGVRSPLALHSPWLSPPVAVGDVPVTEDDTFSMASLYQMLSVLQPPYGQQSTLTALARGTPAMANPKLKPEAQQVLNQALSLQRNLRPENPETLFKTLGKKNHRKLLLPLAVLAAAGVVVYASSHLISKFDGMMHEPKQLAQTAAPAATNTPTIPIAGKPDTVPTAPEAVTLVNETPAKPAQATPTTNNALATNVNPATTAEATSTTATAPTEVAAPTPVPATTVTTVVETIPTTQQADTSTTLEANQAATSSVEASGNPQTILAPELATSPTAESTNAATPNQQAKVTELIIKATETFNAGNTQGTAGTLSILREVWAIDRQDPNARALLNKVIAQQQQQTENRINLNKADEAKISLAQTDDMIREFNLADRIEEQVRLESLIDIREREQREAGDLIRQAKAAIKRGALSKEDHATNAVTYLNKLMFVLPNHPEGKALLEEVVETRQGQIKRQLERNKLSKANNYLDETSRLIRKYNLTGQTRTQASLERDYRQAIEATQARTMAEQAMPQNNATVIITQQEPVEQTTMEVPPPIEGERYVTPNDDVDLINQPEAQLTEPQPISVEVVPNETPQLVTQPQPVPRIVRSPAPEVVANPQPQAAPPQEIAPEPSQIVLEQTPELNVQPEELPAESVIQVQPTPTPSGTISEQGILDTQSTATLPTTEEIPDSERK